MDITEAQEAQQIEAPAAPAADPAQQNAPPPNPKSFSDLAATLEVLAEKEQPTEGSETTEEKPPVPPPAEQKEEPSGGKEPQQIEETALLQELSAKLGMEIGSVEQLKDALATSQRKNPPILDYLQSKLTEEGEIPLDELIELKTVSGWKLEEMPIDQRLKEWYGRKEGLKGQELEDQFAAFLDISAGEPVLPSEMKKLEDSVKALKEEGADAAEIEGAEAALEKARKTNRNFEFRKKELVKTADAYLKELQDKTALPVRDRAAEAKAREEAAVRARETFDKGFESVKNTLSKMEFGEVLKGDPAFVFDAGKDADSITENVKADLLGLLSKGALNFFADKDGKFDFQKAAQTMLVSRYLNQILGSAAKHYREAGKRSVITPHQNPAPVANGKPASLTPNDTNDPVKETLAVLEGLKKTGRI